MKAQRWVAALSWAMAGLAAAGAAGVADAQRVSGWVDADAIYSRPPAQVDAPAATYGIVGARLRVDGPSEELLDFTLQRARGLRTADGGWVAGSLVGELARSVGRFTVGGRVEGFGLDFSDQFSFSSYGFGLRPRVSAPLGSLVLTMRGEATRGRSTSVITSSGRPSSRFRRPTRESEITERLGVTGGALEVARALGPSWLLLTGEAYRSSAPRASGWYAGAGAQLAFTVREVDGRLGLRVWDTPVGFETGYHASLGYTFASDLRLRLDLGRSVRDPLYGVPGDFTATLGMSWEFGRLGGAPRRPIPVVVVGEQDEDGSRRVRFQLWAPDDDRVSLAGDFTSWEPRPMQRYGEIWMLDMVLGPGVYHFGFLVDGERWVVPDGAPGVVEDGWGRKNASFLIE